MSGFSQNVIIQTPKVTVSTTNNRGHNPEELTEMALSKILHVADSAAPEAKAQAQVFQDRLKAVLFHYIKWAARAERETIVLAIQRAGQHDLADKIKAL